MANVDWEVSIDEEYASWIRPVEEDALGRTRAFTSNERIFSISPNNGLERVGKLFSRLPVIMYLIEPLS